MIRTKVDSRFRGNDRKKAMRWCAAAVGLLIVLMLPAGVVFGQVDLYQYNLGEILNAYNQRYDTLLFNDTLAAGDTLESVSIPLIGVYSGRPQYFCAALEVETMAGYPSPGFQAEFRVKFRDRWYVNYDGTERFTDYFGMPAYPWALVIPLGIYGGDSIKYIYTTVDSCIVRHVHWQVH